MCLRPYDVALRHCVLIPCPCTRMCGRLNANAVGFFVPRCTSLSVTRCQIPDRHGGMYCMNVLFNCCVGRYSSGIGHYTQVAWANTRKVGCGFAGFYDSDNQYKGLYVCNYGPGGNVIGYGSCMYQPGSPCTQCPSGSGCVNGLCLCQ
jgi:hypothetical protein